MNSLETGINLDFNLLTAAKLTVRRSIDEHLICTASIYPGVAHTINLNLSEVHKDRPYGSPSLNASRIFVPGLRNKA